MKKKLSAVTMIVLMLVMGCGIINVNASNTRAVVRDPVRMTERRYIKNIVVWEHEAYFVPVSATKCNTTHSVDIISSNFGCIITKSKNLSNDGFTSEAKIYVNQFQDIYSDYHKFEY